MMKKLHNVNEAYNEGSEPSQFVFRAPATLQNGQYVWTHQTKVKAFPNVDVQDTFLYLFYGYSFSADISVLDYQTAIEVNTIGTVENTIPRFQLYLQSDSSGPILRQQIGLPSYYEDVNYRFWRRPKNSFGNANGGQTALVLKGQDSILGSFQARLNHTPSLIGKQTINMIFTMYAQEIKADQAQNILGRQL